jgi:hypothetical protein
VLVNELQLDQAIWACRLHESVTPQTLHYHIKKAAADMSAAASTPYCESPAGDKRTNDNKTPGKEGIVIKIPPAACDHDSSADDGPSSTTTDTSPLTFLSYTDSTSMSLSTTTRKTKRIRRNSSQVSDARIQENLDREENRSNVYLKRREPSQHPHYGMSAVPELVEMQVLHFVHRRHRLHLMPKKLRRSLKPKVIAMQSF